MSQTVAVKFQMPEDMADFRLPAGVNARLQLLLDKQDRGERLSAAERAEAEGLVNLAEFLTILRMRTERAVRPKAKRR